MSSRVLTPDVVGIDALVHDHQTVLAKAEGGVVAVFANNAPAFYAVTPARLAELLALEEKLARPGSDVALDDQLYQEPQAAPVAVPMGKFAMYPDWQPGCRLYPPGGAMGRGAKRAGDHRRTGLIHCLLAGGR